jgi:hypothetical protein
MPDYNNYPIEECVDAVEHLIRQGRVKIFQKWTCASCRSRQTMETPNIFFTSGVCEQCGHETDIRKTGCNYMMVTRAEL